MCSELQECTEREISRPPSLLIGTCNAIGSYNYGSCSGFFSILQNVRDTLAEHQEEQGIPKEEQYGFLCLLKSLLQLTLHGFFAISAMFYNLLPLLEGLLYIVRFILDKIIEISETESKLVIAAKVVLCIFELICITLLMLIIFIFILFPVFSLLANMWGQTIDLFAEPEQPNLDIPADM
ncbi:hypothetical protein FQA39_LY00657 [Lamprigera yunnana]|nr:hypothetical protein FQA39_LY00657 [Lamprigera yunnana]